MKLKELKVPNANIINELLSHIDFNKINKIAANAPKNNDKKENSIELNEIPEFGTKFDKLFNNEYDYLFQENNNINIPKEDYYSNQRKQFFFFPMKKMGKKSELKILNILNNDKIHYNFTFYPEDFPNDFFIYKNSPEDNIKIQLNNKNIIQINYEESDNKIVLYFYLKSQPKVYIDEKKIKLSRYSDQEFFYRKFKNKIKEMDYDNFFKFYENDDDNSKYNYISIKHQKNNDNINDNINNNINNNIFNIFNANNLELSDSFDGINDILDAKKKPNYKRVVSYFNMDDEYMNLYLNDLVIKISFEKKYINKFTKFKKIFLDLGIKTKNNNNPYFFQPIKSLSDIEVQNIKESILKYSCNKFFNNLRKLIPPLQYSVMSLLTVQQINIFHFDLDILSEFLINLPINKKIDENNNNEKKNLVTQEKASRIINEMNNKYNYTNIDLTYEKFILDYTSILENQKMDFDDYFTQSITVTPSKIIYNIPTKGTSNHFQRKLV